MRLMGVKAFANFWKYYNGLKNGRDKEKEVNSVKSSMTVNENDFELITNYKREWAKRVNPYLLW